MAHTYSHLCGIQTTGSRFFYRLRLNGAPKYGVPLIHKKILSGETIDEYNNGEMQGNFTYIDDIVKGIERVMSRITEPQNLDTSSAKAPFKIYNIGNNQPVSLCRFIKVI